VKDLSPQSTDGLLISRSCALVPLVPLVSGCLAESGSVLMLARALRCCVLCRHGANVKAIGSRAAALAQAAAAADPQGDSTLPPQPGFGDTMAKAGALLRLVENPAR
jgi:hypothetical protein